MTIEYENGIAYPAPVAPPSQPEPPFVDPALTRRLRLVLQWRDDVENPEMVCGESYDRHHLALPGETVTRKELQVIGDTVNSFYRMMGSNYRVAPIANFTFRPWTMGEVSTIN